MLQKKNCNLAYVEIFSATWPVLQKFPATRLVLQWYKMTLGRSIRQILWLARRADLFKWSADRRVAAPIKIRLQCRFCHRLRQHPRHRQAMDRGAHHRGWRRLAGTTWLFDVLFSGRGRCNTILIDRWTRAHWFTLFLPSTYIEMEKRGKRECPLLRHELLCWRWGRKVIFIASSTTMDAGRMLPAAICYRSLAPKLITVHHDTTRP